MGSGKGPVYDVEEDLRRRATIKRDEGDEMEEQAPFEIEETEGKLRCDPCGGYYLPYKWGGVRPKSLCIDCLKLVRKQTWVRNAEINRAKREERKAKKRVERLEQVQPADITLTDVVHAAEQEGFKVKVEHVTKPDGYIITVDLSAYPEAYEALAWEAKHYERTVAGHLRWLLREEFWHTDKGEAANTMRKE
jgi:Zn finger protein HypA/HybF involved in hydrogenase expression